MAYLRLTIEDVKGHSSSYEVIVNGLHVTGMVAFPQHHGAIFIFYRFCRHATFRAPPGVRRKALHAKRADHFRSSSACQFRPALSRTICKNRGNNPARYLLCAPIDFQFQKDSPGLCFDPARNPSRIQGRLKLSAGTKVLSAPYGDDGPVRGDALVRFRFEIRS